MLKRRILRFSIIFILTLNLTATTWEEIEPVTLTSLHGLSQNSAYALLRDSDGFLWIGTEEGLNRFNGYTFKVLRKDTANPRSLSGNNIRALLEDPDGNLWIGTDNGLNRLNPKTGVFTRFLRGTADSPGLSDNQVTALCTGPNGATWIGTQKGGLNKYDPGSGRFTSYTHDPENPASIGHNTVNAIIADPDGYLWVGTLGGGLYRFDPRKQLFNPIAPFTPSPPHPGFGHIFSLLQGSDGLIRAGTDGAGLVLLDPYTLKHHHYPGNGGNSGGPDPDHHPGNTILSLCEDQTGVIYLGTAVKGIQILSPWKRKFRHLKKSTPKKPGLGSNLTWTVSEDSRGVLWFGTDNGLTTWDRKTNRFGYYRHNPANPRGLGGDTIRCILEQDPHTMWFGTFGSGLNRWNRGRDGFTQYKHEPGNRHSLGGDTVYSLLRDTEGRTWAGLHGGGLDLYDPAKDGFIHIKHEHRNPKSLSNDFIYCVYQDRAGELWIGTQSGLNRWRKTDHLNLHNNFIHFLHDPQRPTSLSDNTIKCIYEDSSHTLWIGTDRGLNRWMRETASFRGYTVEDGLPNDLIYGILEDSGGSLWLSTNNGLSRFFPSSGRFRNYGVESGLQSVEFNSGAYYKNSKGEMFFGGINGVNYFLPAELRDNPFPPQVAITGFKKFNKEVVLDRSIPYVKEIRLDYFENFFSFSFSALDFSNPLHNRYAYRLEGFDKEWIHTGTNRGAGYTNLDGGSYTFRVKAANADGIWNEEGVSLEVIVVPPYWATWWFRTAGILAFLLILAGFYFRKTYNLRRQRNQLEQMVTERTAELQEAVRKANRAVRARSQFLANMSHEMRTPMNAIIGLTDLTLESPLTPQQEGNLRTVQLSAHRMLSIVDDILKLTRIESGQVELDTKSFHLVNTLISVVRPIIPSAVEKKLELSYHFDPKLPHYLAGDSQRLGQVVRNLLQNAVKFTRKGHIRLVVRKALGNEQTQRKKKKGRVEVFFSITDTGIGIPREKQDQVFEPFVQADGSSTREHEGAGLGLSIATRIVAIMGGELKLKSPAEPFAETGDNEKDQIKDEKNNLHENGNSTGHGPGSCFNFVLPFNVPEVQPVKKDDTQEEKVPVMMGHKKVLHILVAEDNPINRKLISLRLQQLGHRSTLVENGEQVLETLQDNPKFDLILMDLQMPRLDGICTTRAIRRMESAVKEVPIIALTAHNTKEDHDRVIAAGMNAHVAKPFNVPDLVTAIQKVMNKM